MNRRFLTLLGVGLLFVVLCCGAGAQLVKKRCLLWTCAPPRDFRAVELGIPMSYFPADATSGGMFRTHESEGAVDKGAMSAFWDGGNRAAHYGVWRFGTEGQAARFYDLGVGFAREDIPSFCTELGYLDLNAVEFEIHCDWSSFGGYKADLAARYEEFVISLVVGVDSSMTLEDFAEVVRYIDEMMTDRLDLQ